MGMEMGDQRRSLWQAEGWQDLGFMFQFPLGTSLHICKQLHFFHFHLLQNYIDETNDLGHCLHGAVLPLLVKVLPVRAAQRQRQFWPNHIKKNKGKIKRKKLQGFDKVSQKQKASVAPLEVVLRLDTYFI